MLTDFIPRGAFPLRLDEIEEANLLSEVHFFETQSSTTVSALVYVESSMVNRERIQATFLTFRASNIPAILLIKPITPHPSLEALSSFFMFLRDWDQLTLHNIVQLCGDYVPEQYRSVLRTEARIEMKWFQEWLTASHDSRISKYPGLPWRSFIRKTVQENYTFAQDFLQLLTIDEGERESTLSPFINDFLRNKKKAISIFPKRWSKLQ